MNQKQKLTAEGKDIRNIDDFLDDIFDEINERAHCKNHGNNNYQIDLYFDDAKKAIKDYFSLPDNTIVSDEEKPDVNSASTPNKIVVKDGFEEVIDRKLRYHYNRLKDPHFEKYKSDDTMCVFILDEIKKEYRKLQPQGSASEPEYVKIAGQYGYLFGGYFFCMNMDDDGVECIPFSSSVQDRQKIKCDCGKMKLPGIQCKNPVTGQCDLQDRQKGGENV